ncbi:rod shape-determining protein [Weissella viridescens]|jgi:rod shape-determining protein MreB|uniref:Cell shape-determining protein MreB n=1 Tax=Weissella viridescens TaxID=1629 RepID=A0A0R2GYR3_WEIVI|nr:rod shape-determining protein [Weissella viridescens]KRN45897.1 rod shape-determining protein MreB [Weissella viridescens]MBX4173242.1 rod shape-determining protein [Weissella viridescens]MCB6840109.1 rod shape-determining protein [Weissella viridescens]MCB6846841.1 rod shape-determining protein [Weissella viridescens]QOD85897.1 rod shape-determining protein [Weissella viridescens]
MAKTIGIDLGTANVLIYVEGEGIVLNEPSVVAIDTKKDKVLAVGTDAYKMVGRTPGNIRAVRPLKDGVISDFDMTEAMLSYFMSKLKAKGVMSRPSIMVCAPTNITEIERKAIIEAAEKSGGGKVYLEYEPKVAAVGAGLNIFSPIASMVIDMGGGTSDIAVLSLGDIVQSESIRVAGDRLNADIANYIKHEFGLQIGERTAEQVKIELGTALPVENPAEMEVRGRDTFTGMPRTITLDENMVEAAMHDSINQVVKAAHHVLAEIQPELSADVIDRGIVLTGGGALLRGIDQYLSDELGVPVMVSDSPLDNVAKGAGELLEHITKTDTKRG